MLVSFPLETDGIQETFRKLGTECLTCTLNWSVPDYTQSYLADATGITTFCHEIRLSRSWSQVAKSVAGNSSSADLSEHSLMGLRGWGEVVLGSLSWPPLGWERRMKEKEPGGQDGGKEAPGAEALSHPPCFPGSDPVLSLMSQLPSCSQSC